MKIRGNGAYSHQYAFSFASRRSGQGVLPDGGDADFLLPTDVDLLVAISGRDEIGVIVVDRHCEILSCNAAAAEVLDEDNGLIRRANCLAATRSGEKAALERAINHSIAANAESLPSHPEAPLLLISREDRQPLTVSVLPARALPSEGLACSATGADVAAIVLVADPEVPISRSIRPICELYHLTPAETRLAELLIDGLTLAEIADAMGLKLATVRVYLKQIFTKTGVHRQPMLIRMLLTSRMPTMRQVDEAPYMTDTCDSPRAITAPSRSSS